MKFTKTLEANKIDKFSHYYISYRELKQQLKKVVDEKRAGGRKLQEIPHSLSNITHRTTPFASAVPAAASIHHTAVSTEEAIFFQFIDKELAKVNHFCTTKFTDCRNTLAAIYKSLFSKNVPEKLDNVRQQVDEIADDIVSLGSFIADNYTGFCKIIKKHDKRTGVRASPWFITRLMREPFCNVNLDSLLVQLSDCYVKIRMIEAERANQRGDEGGKWVPPTSFERNTVKYWVKPEDVLKVKTFIVKHLPLLIFGREQGGAPEELNDNAVPVDSSEISSVYFDNDELELYHKRIDRIEGAKLFRMRWYGEHDSPEKEIFVERKIHHESWVTDASVKERFSVKSKNVSKFLAGTWNLDRKLDKMKEEGIKKPEEIEYIRNLSHEIQEEMIRLKLHPVVRTTYRRTAFQHAKTNAVRISLDTNLQMLNEWPRKNNKGSAAASSSSNKTISWCRDLKNDPVAPSDVVMFPYAVLEVKLQEGSPDWVTQLVESDWVMNAAKFSKFIHGTAVLHPDKTRVVPYWFNEQGKFDDPYAPNYSEESSATAASSMLNSPSTSSIASSRKKSITTDGASTTKQTGIRDFEQELEDVERYNKRADEESDEEVDDHVSLLVGDSVASTPDLRNRADKKRRGTATSSTVVTTSSQPKKRLCWPFGSKKKDEAETTTADGKRRHPGRVKIEPKTFFANERTFLQWLNTTVFLSMVALSLLSMGNTAAKVSGTCLAIVAVLFALYALFTYHRRRVAISNRVPAESYEDVFGPTFYAIVLIIALSVSGTFSLMQHIPQPMPHK